MKKIFKKLVTSFNKLTGRQYYYLATCHNLKNKKEEPLRSFGVIEMTLAEVLRYSSVDLINEIKQDVLDSKGKTSENYYVLIQTLSRL